MVMGMLLCALAQAAVEEPPVRVKGVVAGKVHQLTFEQPFDAIVAPGERTEVRVDVEGVDLSVALQPRWRYGTGNDLTDNLYLNVFLKCRANDLRLQRFSCVPVKLTEKTNVDMHDKDAENIFTVEVQTEGAPEGTVVQEIPTVHVASPTPAETPDPAETPEPAPPAPAETAQPVPPAETPALPAPPAMPGQ